MSDSQTIADVQSHVDMAVDAREERREARENDYSLQDALAHPVNTLAGENVPQLAYLGEKRDDVCFGNILLKEGVRHYIGKFVIYGGARDLLVISWKSRVGGLFYRASVKDPLGLTSTTRITFSEPNRVQSIEENLFEEIQDRIQNLTRSREAEVSDAVLDELEKGSSGSLKEIVKTIHASQYEIISAERGGLHVIQGAPGTGKTVVGVHRASWLLHPGNDSSLSAEKTLIVGPNAAFIRYIENVIPSLGDEEITHRDLSQLGPIPNVTADDERSVAKIKGDQRMKDLLLQGIRDRFKFPDVDVEYVVPGSGQRVLISHISINNKIESSWKDFLSSPGRLGLATLRAGFRTWLLNTISAEIASRNQSNGRLSQSPVVLRESDIDSLTERVWPSLTPVSFLREFLGSQSRIMSAGRNLDFLARDLLLLPRKVSEQSSRENWTTSDVALLDFLDNCFNGTPASTQYDYIIVDEAQDMTPMQLESIRRRSSTGDFLLMGDVAQATGPWVPSSWSEVAGHLGSSITRFDELQFGYRVPKQVFAYAEKILSHIDPRLEPPRLVRDVADIPQVVIREDLWTLEEELVSFLQDLPTTGRHIGLIAEDQQILAISEALRIVGIEATLLENSSPVEGINLIPISRQKGLEFDDVVIFDPQKIIEIPEIGMRQLYVAVTRSLRRLVLFAVNALPVELTETFDLVSPQIGFTMARSTSEARVSTSDLSEVLRDIEGYLRVKGMTFQQLLDILAKERNGR